MDDTRRKLIAEYFEVIGFARSVIEQANAGANLALSNDPTLANRKDALRAFFEKCVTKSGFMDDLSQFVGDVYTDDDLRALIAFYTSPIGQKTLRLQPAFAAEAQRLIEQRAQAMLPEFLRELEEAEVADAEREHAELDQPEQR